MTAQAGRNPPEVCTKRTGKQTEAEPYQRSVLREQT